MRTKKTKDEMAKGEMAGAERAELEQRGCHQGFSRGAHGMGHPLVKGCRSKGFSRGYDSLVSTTIGQRV